MKINTETQKVNGWEISFRSNVHMYCHQLTVSSGGTKLDIPCEDTPEGDIGLWVSDLDSKGKTKEDLISALEAFFNELGSAYRIYDDG